MTEHNTSGGLTEGERVALFTAAKAGWLPSMGRDPLEAAVERILADRLAAVQTDREALRASRDRWKATAHSHYDTALQQSDRAESAEAENARLRARLEAVEAAVKVMAGEMDAATYLALRAALDSPTSHTQREAKR